MSDTPSRTVVQLLPKLKIGLTMNEYSSNILKSINYTCLLDSLLSQTPGSRRPMLPRRELKGPRGVLIAWVSMGSTALWAV